MFIFIFSPGDPLRGDHPRRSASGGDGPDPGHGAQWGRQVRWRDLYVMMHSGKLNLYVMIYSGKLNLHVMIYR